MKTLAKMLACVMFLAACVCFGGWIGLKCQAWNEARAAEKYETRYIEHYVEPGDTLLDIAGKYAKLDQRAECFDEFMFWAGKDNPDGGNLQAGQMVRIRYHVKK